MIDKPRAENFILTPQEQKMAFALAAHVVSQSPRFTMHTVTLTVESRSRVEEVLKVLKAVATANTDEATAESITDEVMKSDFAVEYPLEAIDMHLSFKMPYVEAPGIAAELQHEEESALRDLVQIVQRVESPKILLELV